MIGRTPGDAIRAFRDERQPALPTITRSVLVISPGGFQPGSLSHELRLSESAVRLSGRAGVSFRFRERYQFLEDAGVRGLWRVQITGYAYAIDDAGGREILAFHWHPESRSHVTTPHIHLGAGAAVARAEVASAHLPTGPVPLTAVLRLLIESFHVRPLRPDWDRLLDISWQIPDPWPAPRPTRN